MKNLSAPSVETVQETVMRRTSIRSFWASSFHICFGLLVAGGVLATMMASASGATPADQGLLAARLAAGEFGPAIDAASDIESLVERAQYLKQVVAAERGAGEFRAAEATARRIPVAEQRARTRAEIVRGRALGGGS